MALYGETPLTQKPKVHQLEPITLCHDTIDLEAQSSLVRTHNPLSCDWLCTIPHLLNCEANDMIVATFDWANTIATLPCPPCAHWLAVVTPLYYAWSYGKSCTPTPWLCIVTGSRLLVTRYTLATTMVRLYQITNNLQSITQSTIFYASSSKGNLVALENL